jgi:DsbC/DsbD-like thiol-disulfide interchange protein
MFTFFMLLACSPIRPSAEVGEGGGGAAGPRPPRVEVALLAEANGYAPGQPIWLAVTYDIQRDWHLYWSNPGDTGLPTTATLTVPEGWAVIGPEYEAPHRFVSPGELVSFGYSDHATLLFQVTPAADASGQASVTAAARWLACKEICVPGEASASLSLSRSDGPWTGGALDAQLASTPKPLVTWPGATASHDASTRALSVDLPGAAEVEVFPDAETWLHLAGPPQVASSERGQLLRLTLRPDAPEGLAPGGVLRATPKGGGAPRALTFNAPSSTLE